MPLKYKSKKKKPSKKYKKRTTYLSVPRSLGKPFPRQMLITHKYVQNDNLVHAAGGIDYQTYSCNSMYDPDVSGVGHQPEGFDLGALVWNHYTVIGSKITCRIAGLITGAGGDHTPCVFTIQTHSSSIPTYTDPTYVAENAGAKTYISGPASGKILTLTSKWSAKKTFGGNILGNTNLQGSSAGAPAEQSYWTISMRPMDQASSVGFQMQVIIEYVAVWRELKSMAQS